MKHNRKKRLLATLLVAVLAFGVTGCASSESGDKNSSSGAKKASGTNGDKKVVRVGSPGLED